MITEDYCNFEIAKLLKEKGFNEEIETLISPYGEIYYCDERSVFKIPHKTIKNSDINIYIDDCSCPTIQMTMKWLRQQGIYITIMYGDYPALKEIFWTPQIDSLTGFDIPDEFYQDYPTYEEACEAAIKYCLTNLI